MPQPGAEGRLQLRPGAADGLAHLVHPQLPLQVFGKVGAGSVHQGGLAALPPQAHAGLAGTLVPPGQQDQQVFQMDGQLLLGSVGLFLFGDRGLAQGVGWLKIFRYSVHQPV